MDSLVNSTEERTWHRWHDPEEPIRVGVSACLLGAEVRFDGGHKRARYLTDVLGESVEWVPVCPEIEVGLGIPRPVMQLRGGERGDRLVVREDARDLTDAMADFSLARSQELLASGLDGFVFKKDSPSCGVARVRVYDEKGGMPTRTGVGHFSRRIMDLAPGLPIEEEGRLNDAALRERFVEALFNANRWRVLCRRGLSRRRMVEFHEVHKMLILAHDETIYRELGRLVGSLGRIPDEEVYAQYGARFAMAFVRPATRGRHVNVLEHLFGHLKSRVSKVEKREFSRALEDYRNGSIPLVVPITLLRFLVETHQVDYVRGQLYLEPHPREMMLRNHA